jgi:hypothetical protein
VKTGQTECSETSAYKLKTPGNYPKESIQHLEHGESLKSRKSVLLSFVRISVRQATLNDSAEYSLLVLCFWQTPVSNLAAETECFL